MVGCAEVSDLGQKLNRQTKVFRTNPVPLVTRAVGACLIRHGTPFYLLSLTKFVPFPHRLPWVGAVF